MLLEAMMYLVQGRRHGGLPTFLRSVFIPKQKRHCQVYLFALNFISFPPHLFWAGAAPDLVQLVFPHVKGCIGSLG